VADKKKEIKKTATTTTKEQATGDMGQYPRPAGSLNAGILKKDPFRRKYSENGDAAQMWTEAARNFNKQGNLDTAGPFLAEVLKIQKTKQDTDSAQGSVGAIVEQTNPTSDSNAAVKLVQIRARIPELEFLPAPKNPLSPDASDEELIEMHPVFTAINSSLPEPKVGDLVWVDYQVNNERTTGVYVSPVSDWVGSMIQSAVKGAGVFPCVGAPLGGTPATPDRGGKDYRKDGLAFSGKSFALPNAGLPPLPRRGPLPSLVGKRMRPKGKSHFTYDRAQWGQTPEKLAKTAAWAGLSWVALRLPANGAVISGTKGAKGKKRLAKMVATAEALRKVGIVPFLWSGTGYGALKAPEQYTAISIKYAKAMGCAGIITDPEKTFYRVAQGKTWSEKSTEKLSWGHIRKFADHFTKEVHNAGFSVGFTSFSKIVPYGRHKWSFNTKKAKPSSSQDPGGWYNLFALAGKRAGMNVKIFAIPQVYTARGKTNKDFNFHKTQIKGHRDAGFSPVYVGMGAYGKGFNRWKGGDVRPHGPKPPSRMIEEILYMDYTDGAVIWWDWNNADHHFDEWGKDTRWDVIRNAGTTKGNELNIAEVKTKEVAAGQDTSKVTKKDPPKPKKTGDSSNTKEHPAGTEKPSAKTKQTAAKTPPAVAQLVDTYVEARANRNKAIEQAETLWATMEKFKEINTKNHGPYQQWPQNFKDQDKTQKEAYKLKIDEKNKYIATMEDIKAKVNKMAKEKGAKPDPKKPQSVEAASGEQTKDPSVYAAAIVMNLIKDDELDKELKEKDERWKELQHICRSDRPASANDPCTPAISKEQQALKEYIQERQKEKQKLATENEKWKTKLKESSHGPDTTQPMSETAAAAGAGAVNCGQLGGGDGTAAAGGGSAGNVIKKSNYKVEEFEPTVKLPFVKSARRAPIGWGPARVKKGEFEERTWDMKKNPIKTLFVIHTTAGGYPGPTPGANKKRIHKAKLTPNVQFWMSRNGTTYQSLNSVMWRSSHATWCNSIAIGIEVQLPWALGKYKTSLKKSALLCAGNNMICMGPGLPKHPYILNTEARCAQYKHYVCPSITQCENVYRLIKYLSKSPPEEGLKIPMKFPSHPAGSNSFKWGHYPNTGGTTGYWRKGGVNGKAASQQGITSHGRWPTHADGTFIEHYVICRTKGMAQKTAFYASIWAQYIAGGDGNKGRGRTKFQHSPVPAAWMAKEALKKWPHLAKCSLKSHLTSRKTFKNGKLDENGMPTPKGDEKPKEPGKEASKKDKKEEKPENPNDKKKKKKAKSGKDKQ